MPNFFKGDAMKYEVLGVYLVDFQKNKGGELSGKHYGLILSKMSDKDKTLLVAPMTSKKKSKKYKFTDKAQYGSLYFCANEFTS